MTRLHRLSRRHGGFTLVELLVVIAIIAVLVGILIPALSGARTTARVTSTKGTVTSVKTAINQFRSAENRLPGYFSAAVMGSPDNDSGFTQMENALLELGGGGIEPNASATSDNIISLKVSTEPAVTIDVLQVASGSTGKNYLSLTADNRTENIGKPNSVSPAQVGRDQVQLGGISATKNQYPDVLDAWGRPIILWSINEAAGPNAALVRKTHTTNQKASFYWQSNAGYLGVNTGDTVHASDSAIGLDAVSGASFTDLSGDPTRGALSMEALLGHPAFPTFPSGQVGNILVVRPKRPRGDFVLQSAGSDEQFLSAGGEWTNTMREFRYLPKGVDRPTGWSLIEDTDDIIVGGD